MLKIYFYLKSERVNERDESSICVRIHYKQESISISTGKYISKERWDFTNKLRNVLKLEKEKVIRRSLDLFHLTIEKKFNELIQHNTDISLLNLRDELKGKKIIKENEISIIEAIKATLIVKRKNLEFIKLYLLLIPSSIYFGIFNLASPVVQCFKYGDKGFAKITQTVLYPGRLFFIFLSDNQPIIFQFL
ncbi:hypothetical protein AR687_22850 [Flavobacteriaceae bacterium CRH]|nr:hypothetical protein AR687_22850 [Flavobacteriaceae bacterium CRH]